MAAYSRTRLIVAGFTIVSVSACATRENTGVVISDSAGVAIVQNDNRETTRWEVEETPTVSIGAENAGAEYQLFRVRGAVRMEDGVIAIANAGSGEVRFYGSDGTYLRSSGNQGEGPGEFRSIESLQRMPGDSLYVYDGRLGRVSVLSPDGTFARSISINTGGDPGAPRAVGIMGNGSIPIQRMRGGIFAFTAGESNDPNSEMTLEFQIVDHNESTTYPVGDYPAQQTRVNIGENSISVLRIPISTTTHAAVSTESFFVGHSGTFDIHRYDTAGVLTQIIRDTMTPRPITPGEIDRLIHQRREAAPNPEAAQGIEVTYRQMEFPEYFPAFDRLLVDQLQWLWVRDFLRPTDDSVCWNVYAPDGVRAGFVFTDRDFNLMDAGFDFILGSQLDEFDIERVVLRRLTERQPA